MALSRKHYNAIADIFRSATDWQARRGSDMLPATPCEMAEDLAAYFKRDNPRFDFNRFMQAAGCHRNLRMDSARGKIRGIPLTADYELGIGFGGK